MLRWMSRADDVTTESGSDDDRTARYEIPAVLWPVEHVESRVVINVPLGEQLGELVGEPLGERFVFTTA